METKELSSGDTGHGPHPLDGSRDVRKEALDDKKDEKVFRPARLPIVLCHGFCGFDTLGINPDFQFDYWYGVREALGEIGCRVYTARVPPFAGIEQRAERLCAYIEKTVPHGSEINLVGHSMGGLDCRFLISHLKSSHFKVRSLTTLGTPHRGSSFANYVMTDIVGQVRLEMFWKMMGMVGIERGAADNLTTHYLQNEFNPRTPDDPQVAYFSYGATFEPSIFSRFRFSWKVIMDREGPNDGLVSLQSAQWGKFIRAIPNADHLDLMNWINALSWGRARFPWILGGSSHDPEGRPKGAFEMDNDDENDKHMPREEPPLFNAIELYLEISDMLNKQGF
ncbi:MAG: triacylglycerol lipase [Benniella sp.]|nr:MAG: triacylglycerol lipase [Benniella sp.]